MNAAREKTFHSNSAPCSVADAMGGDSRKDKPTPSGNDEDGDDWNISDRPVYTHIDARDFFAKTSTPVVSYTMKAMFFYLTTIRSHLAGRCRTSMLSRIFILLCLTKMKHWITYGLLKRLLQHRRPVGLSR